MRRLMVCCLVMGSAVAALAQVRVLSVEVLPLDPARTWSEPRFSPDGSHLYVTTPEYRGIWSVDLRAGSVRQITDEPGSGYGFALSSDGSLLAYRRSVASAAGGKKRQELVLRRLSQEAGEVIASEGKLPVPAFSGNRLVYTDEPSTERAQGPDERVTLLGIEDTRIALLVAGQRRLLDPLGTGRYIWPSLSPDRTQIAAVQMEQGCLVCEVDGTVRALLGRCNAPSWTHDGRWIIGMDDRDDGHRVIGSDLVFVAPDGTRSGRLTSTENVAEMFPVCSPVDDRIACSTLDGRILILTYTEEEGR